MYTYCEKKAFQINLDNKETDCAQTKFVAQLEVFFSSNYL